MKLGLYELAADPQVKASLQRIYRGEPAKAEAVGPRVFDILAAFDRVQKAKLAHSIASAKADRAGRRYLQTKIELEEAERGE